MEILIVGLIVVALMVYASTKIKKEAKAAYEREIFEGEHFTITKPDSFIIPVKEDSEFLFETHSKDFGVEEASDFYKCTAVIKASDDLTEKPVEQFQTAENDVKFEIARKKIIDFQNKKSYELKVTVLTDYLEEFTEKIDELLDSFTIRKL